MPRTTSPRSADARASWVWPAPIPKAGACWPAFTAASIARTSSACAGTERRSKRASSQAACMPPGSRSCGSIATRAGRWTRRSARLLLRRTGMHAVLVTRGSRGMALFQPRQATVHVPIFGSDEVADVTGAGDTVIATFGLALASGASFYEAARLANYAGGIVVMKRGTATVSARELADAVTGDHDTLEV